jgi:FlaA1/EpsC-like NDP-sugar epimerase
MKEQSFKNHGRYVFMFHIVTYAAIIAVIIGSIINLVHSSKENLYSASLLVVVSLILASLAWFSRLFALRAQDRAIRAEENFRHFILTGKPLDDRLHMRQIIALRFAPDEEFAILCQQAVDKNLKGPEIKKAIQNWRADHHRA